MNANNGLHCVDCDSTVTQACRGCGRQLRRQKESVNLWWVGGITVATVLVVVAVAGGVLFEVFGGHIENADDRASAWAARGQFGDMFGVVNAFFSGAAFAGVILTINLQMRELKLQREELELTRIEIRRQREQLEVQNLTLERQRVEESLYEMLRTQHDLLSAIKIRVGAQSFEGSTALLLLASELDRYETECGPAHSREQEQENLHRAFKKLIQKRGSSVGPYFEHLLQIFVFLDGSSVDHKQIYFEQLRAQMSPGELIMLFFFGALSETRRKEFRPLIERYSFLSFAENLPESKRWLYGAAAYGHNDPE